MEQAYSTSMHEIAVGDRVETVGGDGAEVEIGSGRFPVDRVGHPGKGARAKRHDVGTAIGVFQAIEVTVQHGDVGKQMMCQEYRLGTLQVRVARHREVRVRGRRLRQCIGQVEHAAHQGEDRALRPEPQVGRNLVVAGATGVELAGDRADELAQPSLDAGVDILIGDGQREVAIFDLGEDLPEPALEGCRVLGADDPLLAEHAGVGDRAANVFAYQAHVERDRGVERLQASVGRLCEPSAPRFCRSGLLGHTLLLADRRDGDYPLANRDGRGTGVRKRG